MFAVSRIHNKRLIAMNPSPFYDRALILLFLILLIGDVLAGETEVAATSAPTTVGPLSVIIDCDPAGLIATGLDVDDDLALISALSLHLQENDANFQVLGLTITAGNSQLTQSHADALELVQRRIGMWDLPILPGARWWPPPRNRPPDKDATMNYTQTDASHFIVETVMANPPNSITILCLGPLANIAAAFQQEPRIAERIQRLVVMGGILTPHRRLDYNFRFDRTAASIVMAMPCPKILLPVETGIQAAFGPKQLAQVQERCRNTQPQDDDDPAPTVCSFLFRLSLQQRIMPWVVNRQYEDLHPKSKHFAEGFILWDVVALFALVAPELFEDWTYYDIEFLSEQGSNDKGTRRTRKQGGGVSMKVSAVQQIRNISSSPMDTTERRRGEDRNRVLVPRMLRDEDAFQEAFLERLFLQKQAPPQRQMLLDEKDVHPALTTLVSLGLLPHFVFALIVLVCFVIGVYKWLLIPLFQWVASNSQLRIIGKIVKKTN